MPNKSGFTLIKAVRLGQVQWRSSFERVKGFTLIELLVVVTIIGILSTMGIVIYSSTLRGARDAKRQSDLKLIQTALEDFNADQLYYPPASAVVPGGSLIFTPTSGNSKTYMNRIPSDPKSTSDYSYVPSGCASNRCTGYCIYAAMENTAPTSDNGCTTFPSDYNYGVSKP